MRRIPSFLLLVLLITPAGLHAQATRPAQPPQPKEEKPAAPEPAPAPAITQHRLTAGGRTIPYTATAATIDLKNDKNELIGRMFYVAYVEDGADASKRAVTFVFNGGPGSSTMWLHMGSFGPVR